MSDEEVLLLEILDEDAGIAFAELLAASHLARQDVIELVELGALHPSGDSEATWRFPPAALATARSAARLRAAFELEPAALVVALGLLERIDDLQRRVRELECQLLG